MVICGKFFHVLIVACYVPVASLGLRCTGFWRFYTPFTPLGLLEAGAQCAPYKCTFQTGSYNRDGYVVVPDVFDPDRAAPALRDMESLFYGMSFEEYMAKSERVGVYVP